MPDYRITVRFKAGRNPMQGIKFHSSYDIDVARPYFEEQVKKYVGNWNVEKIEVELIPDEGYEPIKE